MVANTLASLRRSRPAHHLRVIRQRLGIAPVRSEQPYATHLPALIALGRALPVRRVLELGTGEFSTACFLDSSVFPQLECLVSVENDLAWAARTRAMFDDDRATLHVVDGAVSEALAGLQPAVSDFDLVFCDDSTNAADRSRTIERVASLCSPTAVIVIHDFEVPAYQEASAAFPHRAVFKAFYPNTGVCWSAAPVDAAALRRYDRTIARCKSRTALSDRRAWTDALSG